MEVGAAVVEVHAQDEVANLDLTFEIELLDSGLLRLRAALTNTGPDPFQVDDVVLAMPVPSLAREILDFAGRWGKERIPQRRDINVGTHLREGRKGRTGADAATVLHLGVPGFSFADGEIWAVHTGWSGNHTHYAERLSTGEQVIGGGELLLPDEVLLEHGASYTTPWIYASLRRRPGRGRPPFPPLSALPPPASVDRSPGDDQRLGGGLFRSRPRPADRPGRRPRRSGSSVTCSTTAGSAAAVMTAPAWATGPFRPMSGRTDCIRWSTGPRLGMQFGLWFEPEMINLDSDVARAHPDWIMATGGGSRSSRGRQQVINLGIPECYAYVRDAMLAILDEYEIGYIKWDHNRDLIEAGTQPAADGRACTRRPWRSTA